MTDDAYEVRSEAHGPHWVAWIVRGNDGRPAGSVLLVGQTKEEAERRARAWADQFRERFAIYSSSSSSPSGSSGSPSRKI
jgi:hypothetical protein